MVGFAVRARPAAPARSSSQLLPGIVAAAQRVKRRVQRTDQVDRDQIGCGPGRRRGPSVHVDTGDGRVAGATPFASSPPMMPVSTSPVPAVASAGPSVRLTWTRPSGCAITVPGPFSTTIACQYARPACARPRSDRHRLRGRPGARTRRRAASGSRAGARGMPDAQRRRVGASALQRVGVDHDRHRRLGDQPPCTAAWVRSSRPRPGPTARARKRPRSFSASRAASSSRCPSLVAGSRARHDLGAREQRGSLDAREHRTRPCPPHCERRPDPRAVARRASRSTRRTPSDRPTTCGPTASRRGSARSLDARRPRFVGLAGIDADVDDVHASRSRPARLEQQPRLQRDEAHGRVGVHRVAADLAGRAVDARRDVDRQRSATATAAAATATIAAAPSSAPRNPVPYIASTKRSARVEGAHERDGRTSRRSRSRRRRRPRRSTRAGDRPSAPLLPLPHATTTRRPYVPPNRLPRPRRRARPGRRGPTPQSRLRWRADRLRPSRQASARAHTTIVGDRSGRVFLGRGTISAARPEAPNRGLAGTCLTARGRRLR